MIDRVYKFIQTVSNNELNGNISPQEYKLLVNNSVDELYESNIVQSKIETGRERRYGRSFTIDNMPAKLREKIMHYYKSTASAKVGSKYPLPSDLRYLDTLEYEGVDVELMQNRKQFKVVSNCADTTPKLACPVAYQIANEVEVAPSDVTGALEVFYLRNPLKANWTYAVLNGTEIFNPDASDFQDIDIHPSEEYNLSVLILQKLGINLKEEELTQYGLRKESTDFQKENAN